MECGVIISPCFSEVFIFIYPEKYQGAPRPCLHQVPQSYFQSSLGGPRAGWWSKRPGKGVALGTSDARQGRTGNTRPGPSGVISPGEAAADGWMGILTRTSSTPRPREHGMPYRSLHTRRTCVKMPGQVAAMCFLHRPQDAAQSSHCHSLAPSSPASTDPGGSSQLSGPQTHHQSPERTNTSLRLMQLAARHHVISTPQQTRGRTEALRGAVTLSSPSQ